MNRKALLNTLLLLTAGALSALNCSASTTIGAVLNPQGSVQTETDSRTAPPPVTGKPIKVIHPSGDFNIAAAKAAIEPGDGTIIGAACVYRALHNGPATLTRPNRGQVVLYPASPYIEDMLKLLHKTKSGTASIEADPSITAVRLEGQTNENGQFQFSKIKPGSYFVVADVHSTNVGARNVFAGTGYSSGAFGGFSTDYYQKQSYYVNYEDILYAQVEVRGDETAIATLFGGTTLFGFNALKSQCH